MSLKSPMQNRIKTRQRYLNERRLLVSEDFQASKQLGVKTEN